MAWRSYPEIAVAGAHGQIDLASLAIRQPPTRADPSLQMRAMPPGMGVLCAKAEPISSFNAGPTSQRSVWATLPADAASTVALTVYQAKSCLFSSARLRRSDHGKLLAWADAGITSICISVCQQVAPASFPTTPPFHTMAKTVLKWVLIAIGILTILVTTALALPVKLWRTGEVPQPELQRLSPAPRRVWVDTDAACGTGQRRDPDDCLALSLAGAAHIDIAGISTVFGNATVAEADQVTRALVQILGGGAGQPSFACARVTAWVGEDALLPGFGGGPAFLVAREAGLCASAMATAQALHCDVVTIRVGEFFP